MKNKVGARQAYFCVVYGLNIHINNHLDAVHQSVLRCGFGRAKNDN